MLVFASRQPSVLTKCPNDVLSCSNHLGNAVLHPALPAYTLGVA